MEIKKNSIGNYKWFNHSQAYYNQFIVNVKSINYFLIVILISILNHGNSYSQSNFESGYIITMQKDTIKGFIDNRNWEKTPDQIVFKSNLDSKEITYNPNNIYGFGFEGESYVSGIVTIDQSPIRDREITEFYAPRK